MFKGCDRTRSWTRFQISAVTPRAVADADSGFNHRTQWPSVRDMGVALRPQVTVHEECSSLGVAPFVCVELQLPYKALLWYATLKEIRQAPDMPLPIGGGGGLIALK